MTVSVSVGYNGLGSYGADTTFLRTYFYSLCMICSKAEKFVALQFLALQTCLSLWLEYFDTFSVACRSCLWKMWCHSYMFSNF